MPPRVATSLKETLRAAYVLAKDNDGAQGVDGETFRGHRGPTSRPTAQQLIMRVIKHTTVLPV
jgi:hypothetical protein